MELSDPVVARGYLGTIHVDKKKSNHKVCVFMTVMAIKEYLA